MLSDRIRVNSEAAPWVIEEVKKMEALLRRCFNHIDLEEGNAVIALRRDIEAAIAPARASADERCTSCPNPDEDGCPPGAITESCAMKMRHPSRIVNRIKLLTDPAYHE